MHNVFRVFLYKNNVYYLWQYIFDDKRPGVMGIIMMILAVITLNPPKPRILRLVAMLGIAKQFYENSITLNLPDK